MLWQNYILMTTLNLPTHSFKYKKEQDKTFIFDVIRRKYVVLTPEEWVRQHFIIYLIEHKNYPSSLVSVEMSLKVNNIQKRSDIVVFNRQGIPFLMVECKAPTVKINQAVFDQIARYNFNLKVQYMVVTNGLKHFCCAYDYDKSTYLFLDHIPEFEG